MWLLPGYLAQMQIRSTGQQTSDLKYAYGARAVTGRTFVLARLGRPSWSDARKCNQAAVCASLQRGPITLRNGVRSATRSRQAAACTAASRTTSYRKGYLFESPVVAGFVCAACTAFMPGSNWRTC